MQKNRLSKVLRRLSTFFSPVTRTHPGNCPLAPLLLTCPDRHLCPTSVFADLPGDSFCGRGEVGLCQLTCRVKLRNFVKFRNFVKPRYDYTLCTPHPSLTGLEGGDPHLPL